MTYLSLGLGVMLVKSDRERYILVAAIVIVI